jgi:asparagine synthase (glutamine-hydrolysing)
MLARFVILIGETVEAPALSNLDMAMIPLRHIYRAGCLNVFTDHETNVLILPGGRGAIIGTLFPRFGPNRSISQHDTVELDRLAAVGADNLLRRYWGSYIACLRDERGVTIIRDPSGSQPCYFVDIPGGTAFSGDVDLLVATGLLIPEISWDDIPRYLCAKDFPSPRTGLVGVSELLAGSAIVQQTGSRALRDLWSPWDHIDDPDEWFGEAGAEKLRRTVQNCVDAWASQIPHSVLMLSGGLDSSVVASCLGRSNSQVSSMTMISGDGFGDEREFARTMAGAIGSHLFEQGYDMDDIDLSCSVAAHFPKPIGAAHERALLAAVVRRCRDIDADAVLTGNGGDNVFYNSSSVRPLFDRLRDRGGWSGAHSTLLDISRVTGVTPTKAARAVVAFVPHARDSYSWPREYDFLTGAAAAEARTLPLDHPWLRHPRGSPIGKRGHVALLLRMQNHIEGYLRPFDIPIINPLTSQPVIELGLSIPTWRQIEGGVNRAVVRRAFANDLPKSILDRRGKGSPSGFAMAILGSRAGEVMDRLMNGPLAVRGFIDRCAVKSALDKGPGMGLRYMRLLAFLDLQAWAEKWTLGPADPTYRSPPPINAGGLHREAHAMRSEFDT